MDEVEADPAAYVVEGQRSHGCAAEGDAPAARVQEPQEQGSHLGLTGGSGSYAPFTIATTFTP